MGKFDDMKLSNFGDTVILVAGNLHVKTEEAMQRLIGEVEAIGYKVELSEYGTNYWFASLQDIRKGKCGSCGELISVDGIQCHGHQCEKCGAVTYWHIIDGTEVRFSFLERNEGNESSMMTDLKMTAKRWDTDAGYIYFYPKIEGGLWTNEARAQAYFNANSDKWEEVEEAGQKLIKMRHTQPWDREICAFNPSEIRGPYGKTYNHSIVKVWNGVEYGEWSNDFPLPDSISLYGTWHKNRLPVSPTIHRAILSATGQTDDKGWHHQDGSPWFTADHWRNMSMFIRHFTELNADDFDKAWPRFRRDGPGGIDDFTAWCHPDAMARNVPNIGNMMMGLSKFASGQPLTSREVNAMNIAAEDRGIMDDVSMVLTARRRSL